MGTRIDIGAREIFVAEPLERDENPVRVFSTFTQDLEAMARWLASCGITTVAMESTGVYWIPLYLRQRPVDPDQKSTSILRDLAVTSCFDLSHSSPPRRPPRAI